MRGDHELLFNTDEERLDSIAGSLEVIAVYVESAPPALALVQTLERIATALSYIAEALVNQ